jgi:uncharacterized metal-binding protein
MERYTHPPTAALALAASRQEGAGYDRHGETPRAIRTRIEETCELARRMGFSRLGLAFCGGLVREAEVLDRILTARGFEVCSVVCKVGCVAKESIGIADHEKIHPGHFEALCNPIAQAEFLNRAGTEMNIMMGLCVGHDALFLKHVGAYTTVLAVKDRVLGHNPLAALYTSASYSRWLFE